MADMLINIPLDTIQNKTCFLSLSSKVVAKTKNEKQAAYWRISFTLVNLLGENTVAIVRARAKSKNGYRKIVISLSPFFFTVSQIVIKAIAKKEKIKFSFGYAREEIKGRMKINSSKASIML